MNKKEVIVPANDLVCLGKDKLQELIRCKDCKYYRDAVGVCIGFGDGHYVMEEDFCSKAERKDNETD